MGLALVKVIVKVVKNKMKKVLLSKYENKNTKIVIKIHIKKGIQIKPAYCKKLE